MSLYKLFRDHKNYAGCAACDKKKLEDNRILMDKKIMSKSRLPKEDVELRYTTKQLEAREKAIAKLRGKSGV